MFILIACVICLITVCMTMPYIYYLANGSMQYSEATTWLVVAWIAVLLIAWLVNWPRDRPTSTGRLFLGVTAWFSLPLILNEASIILNWIGLGTLSRYTFIFRYYSIGVPVLLIIGFRRRLAAKMVEASPELSSEI